MRRIIVACALTSILGVPSFGQGVDPLIGTWKFNAEKSTANTPLVKSFTNTYAGEGQNFTNTSEGVDAQGQPFKIVARHIYDGMPHPTTGTPLYDSTAYTRSGNTISWVRFKNGKQVGVVQAVIDPGKTYTAVQGGIDANNRPYYDISVYDRQ
jgi:hypothetical protein